MNCRLYKDISLGGGDGCMIQDINIGIQDGLYVFNLDDIQGLAFEDDSRPDNSLFIDTIITSAPFYRIDATSINYNEEYNDHYYTQNLTANIVSVRREIEEIMQAAVHGKYAVAFKVIGESHYKFVGWREGLSLDDVLSISSEDNSFQLTFSGDTTYPMMEADKSNFNLREKVFEATFEPLFEAGKVVCSNGWATAMYVVKVNAAGQALDEDNKLCQYSGKLQDAYKLTGVSDGNYHIIGTFTSSDYFEGKSVRMYDTNICNVQGSITVSPSSVVLNSTANTKTITVTSSNDWELVTYPSVVSISRTGGDPNDQTVYLYGTNACGSETLTFRNKVTKQTATLQVRNDRISIGSSYTYPNCTRNVQLAPVLCGSYSVSTTEGTATVNSDGTFTIGGIECSNDRKVVTVTLVNGTETKQVSLIILGNDTEPGRRAIAEWCEVDN